MKGDDPVRQLASAIERHFQENPGAADTAEGIANWWIQGGSRPDHRLVAAALEMLVEQGVVSVRHLPNGLPIYERGRRKLVPEERKSEPGSG